MGGTETDPGIFINWTLRLGTTASRCITFNKFWPISRDLVFDIRILELWVANEVFMKKRNTPKRDFYRTVVMWNRIGKHKAKEDHRKADRRDCYHDGLNSLTNENHCSRDEIHETDERHFEPSETTLAGTNNADDELLIAIRNRLAGVPPMPGSLSLKLGAGPQKTNQDFLPIPSTKHHDLANTSPDKSKKSPTQVSTQVDDSMIGEHRNQSTSTGHMKVASRFTQSGTGLAATKMEDNTVQTQQPSTSTNYQRALPLQNTPSYQPPSRILHQLDEQYQRTLKPRQNSFPNHIKQTTPTMLSPHANYIDPGLSNVNGNSIQSNQNLLSLPRVPDYMRTSFQQPSGSTSIRSGIDEPFSQQIHELSWLNGRNMGVILPYQQQLVRAAQDQEGLYEETSSKQFSPSRNTLTEGSRDVKQDRQQAGDQPYQDRPSPSRSTRTVDSYGGRSQNQYQPSSGRDDIYQGPFQNQENPSPSRSSGHSQNQYSPSARRYDIYQGPSQNQENPSPSRSGGHSQNQYSPSPRRYDINQGPSQNQENPSPSRSLREGDYRGNYPYQDRDPSREGSYKEHSPHRVRIEPDWAGPKGGTLPPPPPTEVQTQLVMTTLEGPQLCKCGSKELDLVCGCKKSILKEVEVTTTDPYFRECRCPSKHGESEGDESKKKRKKKEKKGKSDKEAKAEEKKRKKEEKEREKREKKEQKAREKERRKSKIKWGKKSKNKEDFRMCSCCKCRGSVGDGEISVVETSYSEDTIKKKSKKEKKPKEKKHKEKKTKEKKRKSNQLDDQPFRSCQCPVLLEFPSPPSQKEATLLQQQVQVQQQTVQNQQQIAQIQQQTVQGSRAMGYCNHPDSPCPALGNGETGQVQSQKSITTVRSSSPSYCRDPACSNIRRREMKRTESYYDERRAFRSCSCVRNSVNVCYATILEQQPNVVYPTSSNIRRNSQSAQHESNQSSLRANSEYAGARGYRDITAASALIYPNEVGHGDTANLGRLPTDPRSTSLPSGFPTNGNVLIDLSKRGRENSTNKRYVPPCVLYLDCTKVKDLCVIIKDKYEEDPS